jgi:hypothetical protein
MMGLSGSSNQQRESWSVDHPLMDFETESFQQFVKLHTVSPMSSCSAAA